MSAVAPVFGIVMVSSPTTRAWGEDGSSGSDVSPMGSLFGVLTWDPPEMDAIGVPRSFAVALEGPWDVRVALSVAALLAPRTWLLATCPASAALLGFPVGSAGD